MQNKYVKWIVAIVVLLVLLGIVQLLQRNAQQRTERQAMEAKQAAQNQPAAGTSTGTTPPASGGTNLSLSYNEALKAYGTSRIQFDEFCTAAPNRMTFKSGAKVMLDNRSNDARKIVLDGKVYNIKAFDYALVTLPTVTTTNKTLQINCADLVNVATILLQK